MELVLQWLAIVAGIAVGIIIGAPIAMWIIDKQGW